MARPWIPLDEWHTVRFSAAQPWRIQVRHEVEDFRFYRTARGLEVLLVYRLA